jgi:hypothetical protein
MKDERHLYLHRRPECKDVETLAPGKSGIRL